MLKRGQTCKLPEPKSPEEEERTHASKLPRRGGRLRALGGRRRSLDGRWRRGWFLPRLALGSFMNNSPSWLG